MNTLTLMERPLTMVERMKACQHGTDPVFTGLIEGLLDIQRAAHEQNDDVDAWGAPSECYMNPEPAMERLIRECGYRDRDEVLAEGRQRGLSAKWFYQHGI